MEEAYTNQEYHGNEMPPTIPNFFKVMLGDFATRLRIPKKFMENFRGNLSAESVILIGPSGNKWATQLASEGDDSVLKNGWEKFVQDHELQDCDFLVFQYVPDSSFSVRIFNPTALESSSAIFAKNTSQKTCEEGGGGSMPPQQHQKNENRYHDVQAPSSRKNCDEDNRLQDQMAKGKKSSHGGKQKKVNSVEKKKGKRTVTDDELEEDDVHVSDSSSDGGKGRRDQEPPPSKANSKAKVQGKVPAGNDDKVLKYPFIFKSSRRVVTEEEISKAHEQALRQLTNNGKPSFCIIMKRSHVTYLFKLTIPREYAMAHLPNSELLELRVGVPPNQRTWRVSYEAHPIQYTLRRGWRDFVSANNLEEQDACVFKLAQRGQETGTGTTILDVTIFRVVEELVPLKPVKTRQVVKMPKPLD